MIRLGNLTWFIPWPAGPFAPLLCLNRIEVHLDEFVLQKDSWMNFEKGSFLVGQAHLLDIAI